MGFCAETMLLLAISKAVAIARRETVNSTVGPPAQWKWFHLSILNGITGWGYNGKPDLKVNCVDT
jgi:hypothetical protein